MFSKFSFKLKSNQFNKFVKKGYIQKFSEQKSSANLGIILTGAAASGLAYLMWNNSRIRGEISKSLIAAGATVSQDLSLKRTKDTLLYFSGGIAITSLMVAGMMRSPSIMRFSSRIFPLLLTIPLNFFFIYKIYNTPYTPENRIEKHLYWVAFNSSIAFSLVPLIAFAELLVVRDAFLLTSGVFAGLGLVAVNARDDAFLGMSGFLGAGLGGLMVVGLANIFLQSNALMNIWLYGGLALFTALLLYDMKEIQNRAKRSVYFDPISQSLGIYLDFINIFTRILMILQNKKNKK
jgi:FtsH-binding integral membrane protein